MTIKAILDEKSIYCPSWRVKSKKNPLPKRSTIQVITVHWTGKGVWTRVKQWKKLINNVVQLLYQKRLSKQPHYAICPDGTILQFVPENMSAVHISTKRQSIYDKKWWRWVVDKNAPHRSRKGTGDYVYVGDDYGKTIYAEWFCKWVNIYGPNNLLEKPVLNGNSIGIELVAWQKESLWTGNFTDEQYKSLRFLLKRIRDRHGNLPLITHSDISPITRTTKSGRPWDPPRLDKEAIS